MTSYLEFYRIDQKGFFGVQVSLFYFKTTWNRFFSLNYPLYRNFKIFDRVFEQFENFWHKIFSRIWQKWRNLAKNYQYFASKKRVPTRTILKFAVKYVIFNALFCGIETHRAHFRHIFLNLSLKQKWPLTTTRPIRKKNKTDIWNHRGQLPKFWNFPLFRSSI